MTLTVEGEAIGREVNELEDEPTMEEDEEFVTEDPATFAPRVHDVLVVVEYVLLNDLFP